MKLAIIGGTGIQGRALAARFAHAGVEVIIGSRDAARAAAAATELYAHTHAHRVVGLSNHDAAHAAEIVLLSLPYDGMAPILADVREAVQHKIVINIASALDPERKSRAKVPPAGSTTAEVQQFLGERVRVVAAFQNVAPEALASHDVKVESDILVCGADRPTRESVIALIEQAGMRAVDAGVLANAVAVETLTAVLIAINIKYKIKGAGIHITGLPH
jgi:8-hydroxy-5-deazaflavin:NADPH oxidoreductase